MESGKEQGPSKWDPVLLSKILDKSQELRANQKNFKIRSDS
jgi:hypothetical protein